LAQRHLQLDAVGIVEVRGHAGFIQAWAGRGGFGVGAEVPIEGSYPARLISGELPPLILDAASDPRVADLPLTRWLGVQAYVGVPLHLSDGSVYGVMAGVRCSAGEPLTDRDVNFMVMLSELIRHRLDALRKMDELRADIQDLLDNERIEMAFQPIVDLVSGRCMGVEALARFPETFPRAAETFALAEEVGHGLELEQLAVTKAWPALSTMRSDQFLALNLSPPALLELADRARRRTDVSLERIVVELTEHSVVKCYGTLRNTLKPLRARGLRLSVDDVGAGYASLHHVLELAPDFVKADVSLVKGVSDDHARQVTIKSFVLLAHELGATVIAEGVETPSDLEALQALGTDAAQGFLLGKPSTDPAFLEKWASQ